MVVNTTKTAKNTKTGKPAKTVKNVEIARTSDPVQRALERENRIKRREKKERQREREREKKGKPNRKLNGKRQMKRKMKRRLKLKKKRTRTRTRTTSGENPKTKTNSPILVCYDDPFIRKNLDKIPYFDAMDVWIYHTLNANSILGDSIVHELKLKTKDEYGQLILWSNLVRVHEKYIPGHVSIWDFWRRLKSLFRLDQTVDSQKRQWIIFPGIHKARNLFCKRWTSAEFLFMPINGRASPTSSATTPATWKNLESLASFASLASPALLPQTQSQSQSKLQFQPQTQRFST